MNPQNKDSLLAASAAASRRLLQHVMDIHFDLADTIEDVEGGHSVTADDIRRLRLAAAAVQEKIERLAEGLYLSRDPGVEVSVEEECDEAVA